MFVFHFSGMANLDVLKYIYIKLNLLKTLVKYQSSLKGDTNRICVVLD